MEKDAKYWQRYNEWYDFQYELLEALDEAIKTIPQDVEPTSETPRKQVIINIPSDEDSIDYI